MHNTWPVATHNAVFGPEFWYVLALWLLTWQMWQCPLAVQL